MVKKEVIEFTREDIELLKKMLPDSPCETCNVGIACCGCPGGDDYIKRVGPYAEAGILEYAKQFKEFRTINSQLTDALNKMEKLSASLREDLGAENYAEVLNSIMTLIDREDTIRRSMTHDNY